MRHALLVSGLVVSLAIAIGGCLGAPVEAETESDTGNIMSDAFEIEAAGCSDGQIGFAQNWCRDNCNAGSRGIHYCDSSGPGHSEWQCACRDGQEVWGARWQ
jgi:hypothetical protein